MRTEWKLFVFLGIFMLPLGAAYGVVGHLGSGIEIAGTILLAIVAVSFAFIGVYLWHESRKMDGLRPEDWDASPADGEGEVGAFPAASIWPFVGAAGATILGFGLIFGMFLLPVGLALIVTTVVGMARESDTGQLHHVPFDEIAKPGHTPAPDFSDNVKK